MSSFHYIFNVEGSFPLPFVPGAKFTWNTCSKLLGHPSEFDNAFQLPQWPQSSIIMKCAHAWFQAYFFQSKSPSKEVVQLCWHAPDPGGLKLNTDGSRYTVDGPNSAGGIIRNSTGVWQHASLLFWVLEWFLKLSFGVPFMV